MHSSVLCNLWQPCTTAIVTVSPNLGTSTGSAGLWERVPEASVTSDMNSHSQDSLLVMLATRSQRKTHATATPMQLHECQPLLGVQQQLLLLDCTKVGIAIHIYMSSCTYASARA